MKLMSGRFFVLASIVGVQMPAMTPSAGAEAPASRRSAPAIVGIPVPQGHVGYTQGGEMSRDGTTVAGSYVSFGEFRNVTRAYVWTAGTGSLDLGLLPGTTQAGAVGVTGDGSTVVGYCWSLDQTRGSPFVWTASAGMTAFAGDADFTPVRLMDVTPDGRVIIGIGNHRFFGTDIHFRWSAASGFDYFRDFYTLENGWLDVRLIAGVSDDGTQVVGWVGLNSRDFAAVWDAEGAVRVLPPYLNFGLTTGTGISGDGRVVIGNGGFQALKWEDGVGPVPLGMVPGGYTASPYCLTTDGSIIGGTSEYPGESRAFIWWKRAGGLVDLNGYLPALGIDVQAWRLRVVHGISGDGTRMCGFGRFDGAPSAWVASVPPPPCRADLNMDGRVDSADLVFMIGRFGGSTAPGTPEARADFNGDGVVGMVDLTTFLAGFGRDCG